MKEQRKTVAQEPLNPYRLEGDDFLKNIATGYESWVHHYEPENKRQSMKYRRPGFPSVKKFKTVPSAKKSCSPSFWDARGVLHTEFLAKGSTVNSYRYCANLRSLKKAFAESGRKKHFYFASRQPKAKLQCTNSGRHDKPEIHSGSTPSLQLRFGTVSLLVVPKIEGDVKR